MAAVPPLAAALACPVLLATASALVARRIGGSDADGVPDMAKRVLLGFLPLVAALLLIPLALLGADRPGTGKAIAVVALVLAGAHWIHLRLLLRLTATARRQPS